MWNGIFVRLWYAEITDDAGSGGAEEEIIAPEIDEDSGWKTCPGIGDAGIPGWFDGFFVPSFCLLIVFYCLLYVIKSTS